MGKVPFGFLGDLVAMPVPKKKEALKPETREKKRGGGKGHWFQG